MCVNLWKEIDDINRGPIEWRHRCHPPTVKKLIMFAWIPDLSWFLKVLIYSGRVHCTVCQYPITDLASLVTSHSTLQCQTHSDIAVREDQIVWTFNKKYPESSLPDVQMLGSAGNGNVFPWLHRGIQMAIWSLKLLSHLVQPSTVGRDTLDT